MPYHFPASIFVTEGAVANLLGPLQTQCSRRQPRELWRNVRRLIWTKFGLSTARPLRSGHRDALQAGPGAAAIARCFAAQNHAPRRLLGGAAAATESHSTPWRSTAQTPLAQSSSFAELQQPQLDQGYSIGKFCSHSSAA